MDGVTVISERVVKDYGDGWLFTSVIAGVAAVLLMVVFIWFLKECLDIHFVIADLPVLLMILLACLVFGVMCIESAKRFADDTTHKEYTVTLDESVSYLKFTEKYEVLSEEDGVYRVKEKEEHDKR